MTKIEIRAVSCCTLFCSGFLFSFLRRMFFRDSLMPRPNSLSAVNFLKKKLLTPTQKLLYNKPFNGWYENKVLKTWLPYSSVCHLSLSIRTTPVALTKTSDVLLTGNYRDYRVPTSELTLNKRSCK